MRYLKELLNNVDCSKVIVNDMILKAQEQGAKNFEMLFSLRDGLNELTVILSKEQDLNNQFIEKWDLLMGWVPKVFEAHPLLDLLRNIDNALLNN